MASFHSGMPLVLEWGLGSKSIIVVLGASWGGKSTTSSLGKA